jgi:hypothetical protein
MTSQTDVQFNESAINCLVLSGQKINLKRSASRVMKAKLVKKKKSTL